MHAKDYPHDRPPVFVVGTGRCGSTFVSRLIRDFSDGLSISEFFSVLGGRAALMGILTGAEVWDLVSRPSNDLWDLLTCPSQVDEILWRGFDAERELAAPIKLTTLPHLAPDFQEVYTRLKPFVQALPTNFAHRHWTAIFEWLRVEQGRSYWVERSGGSLEYAALLARHWPNAKFVHVYREGIACALSMAAHPFFRVAVARALAQDPRMPLRVALTRTIDIDRFGAYWSVLICRGMETFRALPRDRVHHLALETLISRPEATVSNLLAFLGDTRCGTERMAHLSDSVRVPASRLSSFGGPDRAALERACRPGMRALSAIVAERG